MAKLHIREYREAGAGGEHRNVGIPVGREKGAFSQATIEIGAASLPSEAFASTTRLIRVHVKAACYVEVGASPVATDGSMPMAANQTEYWSVEPGDKLAVLQA